MSTFFLFYRKVGDSVPVLLIILILFILPIKPDFWCFRKAGSENERPKANPSMLTWEFMQAKLPWGLVLLLGTSFLSSCERHSLIQFNDASFDSINRKWLCFIGRFQDIGSFQMARSSIIGPRSLAAFFYINYLLHVNDLDDGDCQQYSHR